MYTLLLAMKRAARSVYFILLMVLCTILLAAVPSIGRAESIPPAGICDLDGTAESARVVKSLSSDGFIVYESEAVLRGEIEMGNLDCGAIIKKGFSSALYTNELERAVIFVTSPLSLSHVLYENHVSAAIFTEAVPVITAQLMGDDFLALHNIDKEEIFSEYRSRIDSGLLFSFDVESISSTGNFSDNRAKTYLMFFASLLIFSAVMYTVCRLTAEDIPQLGRRIGVKATIHSLIIPNLAIHTLGISLSLVLAVPIEGLIFGTDTILPLLPSLFGYTLLIIACALIFAAILWDSTNLRTLTFILLLMALVMCPAYLDISALWSGVKLLRAVLPLYWLWYCADFPLMALIAAPPLLIIALSMFGLRAQKKLK